MKINKFKKINSNLYEVLIDSNQYKIYDEIILKYNLLVIKEINNELLEIILKDNHNYACYNAALKYLNIKLRTMSEVRLYLSKKEYEKELIEQTLNNLEKQGLFNKKVYLTSYINDQINLSNNGPYKILSNLTKLDFSENEVCEYLDFEDKIWSEKISKYISKKIKTNHKLSNQELKRKISYDLVNLGYQIDLVNSLIEEIKIDDQDLFFNQADKTYNKLSKKYKEPKLSYYFRGKMISSGYSLDLINDYLRTK